MNNIYIIINLNENTVKKKLSENIGTGKGFMPAYRRDNADKNIIGEVKNNSIKLQVKYMGRNSFASIFTGTIYKIDENTTKIYGECDIHTFVKIFRIFFMSTVSVISLIFIPVSIFLMLKDKGINSNILALLVPVFMFIFGVVFFKYGKKAFNDETNKIKTFLYDLYKDDIKNK